MGSGTFTPGGDETLVSMFVRQSGKPGHALTTPSCRAAHAPYCTASPT